VDQPKKQKAVRCKWIFKKKEGITQVEGIDYNEIFSPVVKHCSIRIILGLVNQYDLELE